MPANTPRGYPYPLPAEPVAEGAQAIRNLAEGLDAKAGADLIQTIELAAPGGQMAFNAIPQIYSHLRIVVWAGSVAAIATDWLGIRVNGISSASYFALRTVAQGSSVAVGPNANNSVGDLIVIPGNTPTSRLGGGSIEIPNYRQAGMDRLATSIGGYHTGAIGVVSNSALLMAGVGAITSFVLMAQSGQNMTAKSRASLYGLA